ncbi:MAG: flagellar biosynthesis protein FlhF [Bacillus thermozeamaize]|uniref:Flagellar biosynthesis protein FlhF n=1 Tax=Bacillus thermozeamaize TaxID=230954 RepID=A0A1Y3PVH4_9BACI|nr:MAG: flagellar biosynthesis protein FlhF [Bacillus thermozeamaize]
MIVKKYVADSVAEAMKQIRSELGRDAVILDSKPVKVGGWMGLFAKKKVEVMAAVDSPAPSQSSQERMMPSASAGQQPSAEPALHRQVLAELREMKQAFAQYALHHQPHWPAAHRKLADFLMSQDIHPTLVYDWLEQVQSHVAGDAPWAAVRQCGAETITKWLSGHIGPPIQDETRIVHFVGPTGVGKTTTIAKIAADYVLNRRVAVGLITIDTYRIAAVEQLRTYANILDIPIEVVFSPQEFRQAIRRLERCSLILMDTAGRNYLNPMHLSELKPYLQHGMPSETYVVLSAVAKSDDLLALAKQFASLPNRKLILTKLDETCKFGNLFNLLHQCSMPLAYLTNGQSVPDDLAVAEAEALTKWLLGGLEDD